MRNFWASFYCTEERLGDFEYHGPWYVSGEGATDSGAWAMSVCVALRADSEEEVRAIIARSFDDGEGPAEWRFIEERPTDWKPFSERFPRAPWMRWPWPEEPASQAG